MPGETQKPIVNFPKHVFLLMAGLLLISAVQAKEEFNLTADGVALHGYDPVSYIVDDKPQLGSPELRSQHDGIDYLFSSQGNLETFEQNPARYTPAYGGYCAYGVRLGKKFDTDPMAYAVDDGNLYMLLNRVTQRVWEKDRTRNIAIAERLWPSIKSVSVAQLEE
jgi:YHS domain-containing protein